MPVNHTTATLTEPAPQEHNQSQAKVCSSCHRALSVESDNGAFFDPNDVTILCTSCREQALSTRVNLGGLRGIFPSLEGGAARRLTRNDQGNAMTLTSHSESQFQDERLIEDDIEMHEDLESLDSPVHVAANLVAAPHRSQIPLTHNQSKYSGLRIICETNTPYATPSQSQYHHLQGSSHRSHPPSYSADPLIDITRIRVRSQGHHCLYPGATFQGTQKSGRNSYDVNVTIVDVDFASSFLCGYLRIRGLTDDWPELTTYFDAEIIGSRYGFLTQNWGANEQEDMVHWQRFPAFRHVKHELKKPHLTMSDRDRGAVFMRWKEKFLVPDHRVQDINGASFAGFYYVCVDFNPQPPTSSSRSLSHPMSGTPEMDDFDIHTMPPPVKTETPHGVRVRRDSSVRRGTRQPSVGPRNGTPTPTMSGFYFHQNSEPYQQLSLNHVPERTSSSFEFR